MKHIITGLFAVAAFTMSASAQTTESNTNNNGNYGRTRGEGNRMMIEKLNLTDAQKDQMKAINQDVRSKMEALKTNTGLNDADMQAQRKAIEEDRRSRIAAILTPQQLSQYEEMRKESRHDRTGTWNSADNQQGMQGDRGNMNWGGGDRMDEMKQQLNLSDDQVIKMKSSNESFRDRMKQIRDNQSLTQEDRRAQMEKLRIERQESYRSFLTPEQMSKMMSMEGGRKEKYKNDNGKEKIKIKDK